MSNKTSYRGTRTIDDLPDRIAHRRKIAERIALDSPEYAADDPSRSEPRTDSGYRVHGPDTVSGSGRGPRG
jgi:hypothetical protein